MTQNDNNVSMDIRIKSECLFNKNNRSSCLTRRSTINTPAKNHGFTLVELAIALMVIGLLIGGVLKGQELIDNARVTATIRQFKAYETAAMIFRNTYNTLPGDIKRPNRIPNCTSDLCLTAGNGNGKISSDGDPNIMEESYNFFPHLTKAGMIQGPEGGTLAQMNDVHAAAQQHDDRDLFFPDLPINSYIRQFSHINYNSLGITTYATTHYYYINTTGKIAAALDEKMDDGNPKSGSVHPDDDADCVTADDNTVYDIQNGICDDFMIGAGF